MPSPPPRSGTPPPVSDSPAASSSHPAPSPGLAPPQAKRPRTDDNDAANNTSSADPSGNVSPPTHLPFDPTKPSSSSPPPPQVGGFNPASSNISLPPLTGLPGQMMSNNNPGVPSLPGMGGLPSMPPPPHQQQHALPLQHHPQHQPPGFPLGGGVGVGPGPMPGLDQQLLTAPLMVQKLKASAQAPTRGSAFAAGYDLYAAEDTSVPARGKVLVSSGIAVAVPVGTYGRIAPRSGLASKHFIDTGAGVIDADYRGEVKILLFNHSETDFPIKTGDRVAQLVIERIYTPDVMVVDKLEESVRGAGGFGSTG